MPTKGNSRITFAWIENCRSKRLAVAQEALSESVRTLGLEPDPYPVGAALNKFFDILSYARSRASGPAFVWCNSDITLQRNPYDLESDERVHGFHRTEIPSGEITYGVDMYLIPCRIWDEMLSRAAPDLYCGTSFVDWWITRACQKAGLYANETGYISHVTHGRSEAAVKEGDFFYEHNLREYNRWALRAGVGTVDVPFSWKRMVRKFKRRP